MSASVSRRDNTDRSLARSAWESVPRKNRPVGYGMPGIANPRGISPRNVRGRVTRRWTWSETPPMNLGIIPFCLAMPPMSGQRRSRILEFRTQTRSFVLKTLNVQGTRKCLPWNRCAHLHESHRTLRDGSFGVALSQALRARLRSHRTLRDGSFGVALSQALRARLRSHRALRDGSFGVALSQALRARLRSHRTLRDASQQAASKTSGF
jgi:hypothetical protein